MNAPLAPPMIPVVPESAPFSPEQRAWLNGYFAGVYGGSVLGAGGATPAPAEAVASAPPEEEAPWHDPALPLAERLALAQGRPLRRRLMAAMGQLDCGQCGYLCESYADALAAGTETDPGRCVPGGKATTRELRALLAQRAEPSDLGGAPAAPGLVRLASASTPTRPAPVGAPPAVTRDRPFRARLVRCERLSAAESEKPVRHVVLSLAGSDIRYEPGDALGVWPRNFPDEVELLIAILRARGSEAVELGAAAMTARQALLDHCDLRQPTEALYGLLSSHARDNAEATQLARLAAADGAAQDLGVHDVYDALVRFRSARPPIEAFVAALARMQPRLYSIASSPRRHPGEVHLTVGVVRYELHARSYRGVASNFFAEDLRPGSAVRVYVQPAHGFRLPADPHTPIIMIGPGTGIAPFRAFLEERAATGAPGRNWLFFGAQRRAHDYLYRNELEIWQAFGLLARLDTAFSRDQRDKVYVQHRMLEHAAEIRAWLHDGAHVYVCGDARRMAADVDAALRAILAGGEGGSESAAREQLLRLAKSGRYQRDVY
jgi:sulfite reductase (NADPH) flavoprotein alpha-component